MEDHITDVDTEELFQDDEMFVNNEPIIEELHDGDWETFYDHHKAEVHAEILDVGRVPNGHFAEWCSECRKEFIIAKTQLFCPRCGYPIIREEDIANGKV